MPAPLPFDPTRSFKAAQNFLYDGDRYIRNDPFPNPGVEVGPRRLKQLWQVRKIAYDDEQLVRTIPEPAPKDRGVRPEKPGRKAEDLLVAATEAETAVKALVDGNSKADLLKQAEGLEVPAKATKTEIAELIVKAGRHNGGDS